MPGGYNVAVMTTKRATLLLLLLFVAVARLGASPIQDPPAPAAPTHLLEIQATAVDKRGNPVTDLKPSEFEVWIGGYRVPIETVTVVNPSTPNRGRLFVLLLDDITLQPMMVTRAREVARRFVDGMQPGDRIGVLMLNSGGMQLTSEPAQLRQQIDRFKQSLGVMPVDQLGYQLLIRVAAAARSIVEAPESKKTIVAIGSGWLLDTPVPPAQIGRDVREEWYDAMRALAVADATYYVIDPGGVGSSRTGSVGLAREAGGHAFVNTNDLDGAVDQILRETDHYYALSVGDPPVGRKAVVREMDVRVLRRGVTVRAPRSIPGGQTQR